MTFIVGGGVMKEKRVIKPQHIRQILSEQINLLRTKGTIDKAEIDKARAIGYLASIALTAMKDGDLEERIATLEKEAMERENE